MNALFVLCGLGVVSLLAEITSVKKGLWLVMVLGLAAAGILFSFDWGLNQGHYSNMVVFDNFSLAYSMLISVSAIFWFFTSRPFFENDAYRSDRSALIMFAVIGALLMIAFNNFAILFLGIEILSISLYVLAGSRKNSAFSNEASFKYFLMGSFATGFFLFGVALLYGATGSFDITVIAEKISNAPHGLPGFFYVGVMLILAGMAFKMSAAPFHFWAPDVYEGSPTAITAFMSTIVKIASIGAFFKVFSVSLSAVSDTWSLVLQIIMVLTLVIGNVTAVYQSSLKRILAYSSIGHIGYVLLAMIASETSDGVILYYLSAYTIASLSAFGVLVFLEREGVNITLSSLQGLFYRNSLLAVLLTVSALSLAGIPPLAGFFAKYLVFSTAMAHGFLGLVIVGVVTSLIGVYYYFGIIKSMFLTPAPDLKLKVGPGYQVLFFLLLLLNFAVGLFPDPLISLLAD
jgi:NADH-quinone oxidoreductase subunit N